jgi:2-polyprenyl-6-methoxyphenol hydroxylase-like FAD-dependent oxidoreductase
VHYRLNRKKFRQLLSTDIPVKWGKRFTHFETVPDGVLVHFSDGSVVKGSMLLGIEGKNSRVKRLLVGEENAKLNPLPVAFVGISLRLSPARMAPFKAIHPVLWQGSHPGSGYFLFFSMLSTPESNGSAGTGEEFYEGQFNMSWLVEKNGPTPATGPEQIAKVKKAAVSDTGFFPGLREAVLDIPEDSPVLEIKLEDWPTQMWPNAGGRVQLVGDAAHTMTMCMSPLPPPLPLHPSLYMLVAL